VKTEKKTQEISKMVHERDKKKIGVEEMCNDNCEHSVDHDGEKTDVEDVKICTCKKSNSFPFCDEKTHLQINASTGENFQPIVLSKKKKKIIDSPKQIIQKEEEIKIKKEVKNSNIKKNKKRRGGNI